MALGAEGAAKPRLQDVTWHGQAVLSTADKGTMCFLLFIPPSTAAPEQKVRGVEQQHDVHVHRKVGLMWYQFCALQMCACCSVSDLGLPGVPLVMFAPHRAPGCCHARTLL